jgi:hypothetical protein
MRGLAVALAVVGALQGGCGGRAVVVEPPPAERRPASVACPTPAGWENPPARVGDGSALPSRSAAGCPEEVTPR